MPAKRQASVGSALALLPSPDAEVASPLLWPQPRAGFDGQVDEVAERLASGSEHSKTA
jgi:hypothetical protein